MNRGFLGTCLSIFVGCAMVVIVSAGITVYADISGAGKAGAGNLAAGTVYFADVDGHWAKAAIQDAMAKGYVDGYEDATFRPDRKVSRAEFLKMTVAALKLPVSTPASGDNWYTTVVNEAVFAGLHHYEDFTSGDWNTPITRLEMARIALRASDPKLQKPGVLLDEKALMYNVTQKGLIQGMDDTGSLGLDDATTRAQSVTIIERILTARGGGTLPMDKHAVSRAEVLWHGTNVFTMLPRYFSSADIGKFDLAKFKWDSSDGIYHEEATEYIAVDMEDPNDPYRSEVEGLPFSFMVWHDGTLSGTTREAPTKSFVTFSKVKMTINGKYPDNLYVLQGGGLGMADIGPIDVSNWQSVYSSKEDRDTIYFSKSTNTYPYVQWNQQRFSMPQFAKDLPSEGGTYYWISGQVHPKGDQFFRAGGSHNAISFAPNIRYMKTYGPESYISENFNANLSISNP